MVRKGREIILLWIVGILICGVITAVLVHIAYMERGYWAIGGEYSLIPLTIVICTCQTDKIRRSEVKKRKMTTHSVTAREP